MTTTHFQEELLVEIKNQGADFIHFVDISHLSGEQNKGYPTAILFGIALSKTYLRKVAGTPDYVEQMKSSKTIENDEFYLTEMKTDGIANRIEEFLVENKFEAYSQSENNIIKTGYFNKEHRKTPLPHKTIAMHAGIGWIGKHNLLVTPKYGSAISMCSVLTNAPLKSKREEPMDSRCGDCTICRKVCKTGAIKGNLWEYGIAREKIIDVFSCTTCFQCVVQCPWTQKYFNNN
ncbi:hypothetical protein SAMN05444274_104425 [Mariniphaga anaerophila]|uniref:4Fe-4S ferredoxin-type domain-containing protein n=1 Tax=Mariniphaga anaerophila TaxID=1484053 RepID=A0A1M5AQ99_9BACT|nr:4Fe-4S dicluster domain-containing protein [Mariniphaga anaerophila]SHF32409.1 hypothetical protein SAMN05444274_104425 [Mariniphaga anaerophila]